MKYRNIKIKDIGRVVTGKTPVTSIREYYDGEYMFISPSELHGGFRVGCSEKTLTERGLNSIKNNIIDGTTVLVGCIGWDMGNVAMTFEKCATNQQINSITDFRKDYNPYYVYYWLSLKKEYLFSIASVTRTPILSKSVFENVEIPIPSINYQDKVVDLLLSLDKKIENNQKINDNLLNQAKDIFDYWFTQFDFPNELGTPYKSSGGKMRYEAAVSRNIPYNWEITTIGDITICLDSKRIPLSSSEREKMHGNIPYYGATGIMDYVDKAIFDSDYVLLAEDGSVMNQEGKPILQRISGPCWINNHAHVLAPIEDYSCILLFMLLKDIPVVQIKTGSIQMKINQENLNNYKIIQIPDKLRREINAILEPFDRKILEIQRENDNLHHLRDWLLPLIMNGQATIDD